MNNNNGFKQFLWKQIHVRSCELKQITHHAKKTCGVTLPPPTYNPSSGQKAKISLKKMKNGCQLHQSKQLLAKWGTGQKERSKILRCEIRDKFKTARPLFGRVLTSLLLSSSIIIWISDEKRTMKKHEQIDLLHLIVIIIAHQVYLYIFNIHQPWSDSSEHARIYSKKIISLSHTFSPFPLPPFPRPTTIINHQHQMSYLTSIFNISRTYLSSSSSSPELEEHFRVLTYTFSSYASTM